MKNQLFRLMAVIKKYSSLKNLSILLLIIVILVSYFYLTYSDLETTKSQFGGLTLDEQTIQGGEPVSPEYQAALTKADYQRVQDAKATGTSAVPTIVLSNSVQESLVLEKETDEVSAVKLPRLELPKSPIQVPNSARTPTSRRVTISQPKPPDPKTLEKIAKHIENLRPNYSTAAIIHLNNSDIESAELTTPQREQSHDQSSSKLNINLPKSGTVFYGQLITQVNSDTPGPILAQILQGPFKGARLIGSFEVNRESATLNFREMSNLRDHHGNLSDQSISINAIAVDTQHIGTSLVSKVDRHMIEKIGFGFIAGFAQGLSNVLPRLNKTTIEVSRR